MNRGYWWATVHGCSNLAHTHISGRFPDNSMAKTLPDNAGDAGLISGSERPPGGGNGNPLQDSGLRNPIDR